MKVTPTSLNDVLLVEPAVHGDARGFFKETFHKQRYAEHGIGLEFMQDNVSYSGAGILRGMHMQNPHSQGKLVYVLAGAVFDVAVDLRHGSPQFGTWVGVELSATNHRQLWVPPGFAHGFCVLGEEALFVYKCTDIFHGPGEITLAWDDPDVGIKWPITSPKLSDKDLTRAKRLKDIPVSSLVKY